MTQTLLSGTCLIAALLTACSPQAQPTTTPPGANTTKTPREKKGLRIEKHTSTSHGSSKTHSWALRANTPGDIEFRLLRIEDGASTVMSESLWTCDGAQDTTGTAKVQVEESQSEGGGKTRSHALSISLQGATAKAGKASATAVIQGIQARNLDHIVENGGITSSQPTLLFLSAFLPGGEGSVTQTLEALMESSKTGARFVVVRLDWNPK